MATGRSKVTSDKSKEYTHRTSKNTVSIQEAADNQGVNLKDVQVYASINKAKGKDDINNLENLKCIPKDGIYKVKKVRNVNVSLNSDSKAFEIYGCCVTEDGYLLLTDHFNSKLKRLYMSTEEVKDYLDLPDHPFAICTVSKNEAAVTLKNQSVQFVSLEDKMAATRNLRMNHFCYSLAHIDGKLIISDCEKTVYIYNINGKEQRRVTTDGLGNEIFSHNRHIAVSSSGDQVFVSDMCKGLVVLDYQGNHLSTHTDHNVSCCRGVCTDGMNVFVSGFKSEKIVQFGHDLNMLGTITEGQMPNSMTFDNQNKKLIATFNNHEITILELS